MTKDDKTAKGHVSITFISRFRPQSLFFTKNFGIFFQGEYIFKKISKFGVFIHFRCLTDRNHRIFMHANSKSWTPPLSASVYIILLFYSKRLEGARTKSGAKGMGQCYRRSYLDIGLGFTVIRCRDIYDDPAWQVLIYISDIIHYIYSLAPEIVISQVMTSI